MYAWKIADDNDPDEEPWRYVLDGMTFSLGTIPPSDTVTWHATAVAEGDSLNTVFSIKFRDATNTEWHRDAHGVLHQGKPEWTGESVTYHD